MHQDNPREFLTPAYTFTEITDKPSQVDQGNIFLLVSVVWDYSMFSQLK